MDRRFIVSYFLSDDTILVFEPPQRNSGIIGGKFIERRRIKTPDEANYYTAQVSQRPMYCSVIKILSEFAPEI